MHATSSSASSSIAGAVHRRSARSVAATSQSIATKHAANSIAGPAMPKPR